MTTSRSHRLFAPLVALGLAACGPGAQPAQSTTPAAITAAEPAPAAPAAPAGAEAPAAKARPTAPGPNLTPDGVVFSFKPEGGSKAKKIFLAGNFNDWKPDNPQYLMTDDNGTWSITVKLPPGTYQYKYVADGQWIKDPYSPGEAPDGFGGRNGKFEVR